MEISSARLENSYEVGYVLCAFFSSILIRIMKVTSKEIKVLYLNQQCVPDHVSYGGSEPLSMNVLAHRTNGELHRGRKVLVVLEGKERHLQALQYLPVTRIALEILRTL